jgi:hypothetical protein
MSGTIASGWVTGDIVTAGELTKMGGCVFDSTLAIAAASFDITGLPTTYAHLRVEVQARSDAAATDVVFFCRLNNDSAANYDTQYTRAYGASFDAIESLAATSITLGNIPAATAPASVPGGFEIVIPNYAATTFNKTLTSQGTHKYGTASTNARLWLAGGHWRSSAAINRITLTPSAGSLIVGSRVSVYVMGS